ncbi:uncharacterized protein [Miscanthus floridulus]|uniref:uncharacterized protein n=1 Tax=Miscanthus floridulus TaxID=154761 RepID=UPI0034580CB5
MKNLVPGGWGKLAPKYARPFQVTGCIGEVAYHLQLPKGTCIHDVFHVDILKPFRGMPPSSAPALPPLRHGRPLQWSECVLRSELHRGMWHILVEWVGMPVSEATWELVLAFHEAHPSFQLEDELFPEGGRDVMVSKMYEHRAKEQHA